MLPTFEALSPGGSLIGQSCATVLPTHSLSVFHTVVSIDLFLSISASCAWLSLWLSFSLSLGIGNACWSSEQKTRHRTSIVRNDLCMYLYVRTRYVSRDITFYRIGSVAVRAAIPAL